MEKTFVETEKNVLKSEEEASVKKVLTVEEKVFEEKASDEISLEKEKAIDESNLFQANNEIFLNTALDLSSEQLDSVRRKCDYRSSLLNFLSLMKKFNIDDKLSLTMNALGTIHLTDCQWCNDKIKKENGYSCLCHQALKHPQKYVCGKYGFIVKNEEEAMKQQISAWIRKCNEHISIVNYTT